MIVGRRGARALCVIVCASVCSVAGAQDPPSAAGSAAGQAGAMPMDMPMDMPMSAGWTFMQDGIAYVGLNHQGGPRGGTDLLAPNWWMGMASRGTSRGKLTFDAMLSLDPATVGEDGYRELFQAGEALNGQPLIDRQHPHDLFMQLAAIWRLPVGASTGFTIAGGPAGEPALGPVAFMHRASAVDNPTAPLGHHTFDSTHVAFGVVTAAVDHGPLVLEGSVFNGREPDQHRWDFDFGRLDSFSGRVWYRPAAEWEFQISSGRLAEPEELEPGQNVVRSTASGSWTRTNGTSFSSVTVGLGRNDTSHGSRSALLVEGAHHKDAYTLYARLESVQLETSVLQTGMAAADAAAAATDTVFAFTAGGVRSVLNWRGFNGGLGADVTMYGVPAALQPMYSAAPVSFHVFFRLRPPAGAMGRMLNMRMSQPMAH